VLVLVFFCFVILLSVLSPTFSLIFERVARLQTCTRSWNPQRWSFVLLTEKIDSSKMRSQPASQSESEIKQLPIETTPRNFRAFESLSRTTLAKIIPAIGATQEGAQVGPSAVKCDFSGRRDHHDNCPISLASLLQQSTFASPYRSSGRPLQATTHIFRIPDKQKQPQGKEVSRSITRRTSYLVACWH
jgi:hypothetical protein